MKKIILALVMFLLVPILAFADAATPPVGGRVVMVKKTDGTELYDINRNMLAIIPVNTVLTVNREIEIDGIIYGDVVYSDVSGYVNMSHVEDYDGDVVNPGNPSTPAENPMEEENKEKSSNIVLYCSIGVLLIVLAIAIFKIKNNKKDIA